MGSDGRSARRSGPAGVRLRLTLERNLPTRPVGSIGTITLVREFQVSTVLEPLPPAFLDRVVSESMKVPARVWRDVLAGVLVADAKDELGRIRAATLILRGAHDELFDQAAQDALLRDIPRAHLITYPGVGHAPHWEAPDRVLADLLEFLDPTDTAAVPPRREHDAHGHRTPGPMPLLPGLGDWRHEITTASTDAQRYFDQGLRLVYGFNHDEAVRSFERAVQLDSTCAMCYWGIALALGPNGVSGRRMVRTERLLGDAQRVPVRRQRLVQPTLPPQVRRQTLQHRDPPVGQRAGIGHDREGLLVQSLLLRSADEPAQLVQRVCDLGMRGRQHAPADRERLLHQGPGRQRVAAAAMHPGEVDLAKKCARPRQSTRSSGTSFRNASWTSSVGASV
jgi:hypothetical protein